MQNETNDNEINMSLVQSERMNTSDVREYTHPAIHKESNLAQFSLEGKVAVITGGAGLLGAQFCHTLAQAGAKVVVVDANSEGAQKVSDVLIRADEINHKRSQLSSGLSSISCPTDITDPLAVAKMVSLTLETFGRLDILVNSAALDPKFDPQNISSATANDGSFENFPLEAWKQALDVNLTGAFLCSQAAVKPMLAQGGGVIINIASTYGLVGPDQRLYQKPGQPAKYKPAYYTVTKAGIVGFTRYLAAYYAGKNIRVNTLTPGGVFNNHDDQFVHAYSERTILGRMANKDEMNGALLFLASDASSYMTGSNLVVDGGWTAW